MSDLSCDRPNDMVKTEAKGESLDSAIRAKETGMLRHKKDLFNAVRGFTAPLLFFLPFYTGFPQGNEFLVAALLWLVVGDINHVLHLHIHHAFFKNKLLNLILELCMGMVTGMTASNWRIQHVHGHHKGVQHDYGSAKAWEMRRFSITGALSYSTRTIWPIFFDPISESFRKGIQRSTKYPLNYRWAFIEQCGLLSIAVVLFVFHPVLTISFLLPWYVLVYFISRYTDYLNHFSSTDLHSVATNNSLNQFYNWAGWNFGYHSAHHYRPDAHWTELPTIHNSIAHSIPGECIKPYGWSGFLMPYHFYLSLRGRM